MAITKILYRNGGLRQAIDYITNPSKTDEQLLTDYVHCDPGYAAQQMMDTKRALGKTDGRQCYHIIQSFKPDEITQELAHEIAKQFAAEHLSGYEAVIATHVDKAHIHSHIVFNSVNAVTGKMYHSTRENYYQQIRRISDRLCRENGLSIILQGENTKTISYIEWLRQSKGQPTFRSMLEADLREAIADANDLGHFFLLMEHKGYEIHHGNRLGFRLRGQERYMYPEREFYKKVFNDYREPIFHIHLNADYPLNFKGILYFPRMTSAYEGIEGQIKLFYNRVFVADNIKEIIPDYLLMLKGVLDCPEMPLNVSRSYLQSNAYVAKVSAHIVKKVCDKLVSMHDTEPDKFKKEWDELKTFVKYASMRDRKVYDKLKDIVLMETVDGDYVSLKEYLETAREKDGKKVVYYATDKKQQAVYINMFKNEGINVVVLADFIDNNYMSIVEQSEEKVKFLRIDAEADALKTDGESAENEKVKELFAKISGNDTMKITFMPLKDTKIPALLNIDEESRRFSEMMKMYAAASKKMQEDLPQQATLVLNTENALIKKLETNCENGASDIDEAIARQIYTLALIGQRQLTAAELESFLDNSYGLLEKL